MNELKEERSHAKVENPYFMVSPDKDLVFAHMRLGKLYEQMGKLEKSREHFEQAISHSKEYTKLNINTQEDCVRKLDALDKAHTGTLERQRNEPGNDE